MPVSLIHRTALPVLLALLGCVTPDQLRQRDEQIGRLQRESVDQYNRSVYLRDQLGNLQASYSNFRAQYFREKTCKNPKLSDFLAAVAHNDPEICRPIEFDKALLFMKSQASCIVYLQPAAGLSSLHPARQAFLLDDLLKPEQLHPSSRLLILVQPHGETPAERDAALAIARSLQGKIQSEFLPPGFRGMEILGPHLLPCSLRNETAVQRLYNNDIAIVPLLGEPQGKQPRIRIWIFRSDC